MGFIPAGAVEEGGVWEDPKAGLMATPASPAALHLRKDLLFKGFMVFVIVIVLSFV
jgi:hypothetical protein